MDAALVELRAYRNRILWWTAVALTAALTVILWITVPMRDPWYAMAVLGGAAVSVVKFLMAVENVEAFAAASREKKKKVYVGRGLGRYALVAVLLGLIAWATAGNMAYLLAAAAALFLTNIVIVLDAVVAAAREKSRA